MTIYKQTSLYNFRLMKLCKLNLDIRNIFPTFVLTNKERIWTRK